MKIGLIDLLLGSCWNWISLDL